LAERGRRIAMPMVQYQKFALASLHCRSLGWLVVIVTEDVQHTVNNEQRQFVIDGAGVLGRLPCGDRRTDDDVTQQQGHVGRVGRGSVGTAAGWLPVLHDR
jgi:hypothetical protein